MMNQAIAAQGPSIVERLLQRIENEPHLHRARHPPADDPPGEGINDKRHIDEARPDCDIGEVRQPQSIWPWHTELAVHAVFRTGCGTAILFHAYRLARSNKGAPGVDCVRR